MCIFCKDTVFSVQSTLAQMLLQLMAAILGKAGNILLLAEIN
jgi:hypothetical protein